jgi:hypothetical protein
MGGGVQRSTRLNLLTTDVGVRNRLCVRWDNDKMSGNKLGRSQLAMSPMYLVQVGKGVELGRLRLLYARLEQD